MKITTKVIGLLAVLAVYSGDAGVTTKLSITQEELHTIDKNLDNILVDCAKDDPSGIVGKISSLCEKLDPKIELESADKNHITSLINSGIQDHQDRITPTALTGDIDYKFTYMDGSNKEEVRIARREITNLLGKMAKLRMSAEDLNGMLNDRDKGPDVKFATELAKKNKDLKNGNEDLLIRIVKLIKCLATKNESGTMYESLVNQMKDKVGSEGDCLQAAHAILLASLGAGAVEDNSALKSLVVIVNNSDLSGAKESLTAPVLQAFTTLLFLQRTEKAKNGEVKNLNQYWITRGNARKVMKDTGGKLLLCDDISLEKSGLLALGMSSSGITDVTNTATGSEKLDFGKDAYVLPAAVLLDDEGKPVVGTPVIPAPYLEYAINNNELVPASNIIVDGTDGVTSVLTTYGTSLGLKAAATVVDDKVADVDATDDTKGLSGIEDKIVASSFVNDATKMIVKDGAEASGTNTSAESDAISLDKYGAQNPIDTKTFKFSLKAATAIMNSLLANTIAVKSSSKNDHTNNINKGPFYVGRIAATACPIKKDKFTGEMLNSTAAIMLMSGKDGLRAKQDSDEILEVSDAVENNDVVDNIAAVSAHMIPGFDLDANNDYVVTGLNSTTLDKLDGKTASLTSDVLKGKGSQLLTAISQISKNSK